MHPTVPTTVKVTKCKLKIFEHTVSMSKWPEGIIQLGNTLYYLRYLFDPFFRGLEVDIEESSTFPTLVLSIHIDKLGLFYYL